MLPAFSNTRVSGTLASLANGRLQPHEHDVKAAGLELDRGARRDLDAFFELAHAHDVALHLHFMDLGLVGSRAFDGDQAIGRRPVLVSTRKPPPDSAVGGVARVQGWRISIAPCL